MKLNPSQQQAVQAAGQNVLVSAGAGTGKTRVLVERFLDLVLNRKVLVTEILALTFTDKAAAEMKSRIFRRFKEKNCFEERRQLESAAISTLHAFAARILREHPLEAGIAPDFRVIEAEEADFMKEQALLSVFEAHCHKGTGIFDLMRTYGETVVREGLLAIFRAARHGGQSIEEFLQSQPSKESLPPPPSPKALLKEVGEDSLVEEWLRFETLENWDWAALEDFKAWLKGMTKRKAPWPEIKLRLKAFLAWKLEAFTGLWRDNLKALALAFEAAYETAKAEEGFLDFDDLEMRATGLFRQKTEASERIRELYRQQYKHILVDEFQDTSPLQMALVEFLAGKDNLFLVGDYKQSIYAFRGAEPGLFLAKETAYQTQKEGLRISLLENYRTVPGLLNWVNRFFERLWEEDAFRFEALQPDPQNTRPGEIRRICIEAREGEDKSHMRLREAERIAAQMKALHDTGYAYGDMAMLFEAMTDAPIYEYALKKAAIPYFSVSSRGFYQQPEVRDMMSLLSFLENPFADIPLASVLRSPFFQITDNTLYRLARHAKEKDKTQPLYRGVLDFENIQGIGADEKDKLVFFRETSAELMRGKDKLRLSELFDLVLERTGYELALAAGPDSARRLANLKKLAAMARQEEVHGPLAAGDFLQRVKQLELQEVRESEAQIETEQSGKVVRLMTIHKSKGLEFKVVFVADMGREGRSTGTRKIMAESGEGVGLQVWNESARKWEEPAGWQRLRERLQQKEREERKRLLYVAMTRAKEKLFLSGLAGKAKEKEESFYKMASWMDWLDACAASAGTVEDAEELPGASGNDAGIVSDWSDIWQQVCGGELAAEATTDELIVRERLKPRPRVLSRAVDLPVSAFALFKVSPEAYSRVYEAGMPEVWSGEADARPKTQEESAGREILTEDLPADAADFGTAMHALFERLDFRQPEARLEELLEDCFSGLPSACRPEARRLFDLFRQTELFSRLQKARRIERELPFVLKERHGLIQGVIDVLFEDAEGWHILDYKTAEGSEAKVAERGYRHQIELYAVACRRLLGCAPKSGILYFLKNQWQYVASLDEKTLNSAETGLRQAQEDILETKNRLYRTDH